MYEKQSYDDAWEHFILDMKDKYPIPIIKLEGIDNTSLDRAKFRERYIESSNVSDASLDANANVQIKTVATYHSEKHKGSDKLDSLYDLWDILRKEHGTREANRLLEREIRKDLNVQDVSHTNKCYCWAFDVYDLLTTGLPFVVNYPSRPAKYSDVFLQHVVQLVQFAASQMMGATAIPNFIVIYSALLKHDSLNQDYYIPSYKKHPDMFNRYVRQRFQELAFLLNQPLRESQSCFTNITVFDRKFMDELCKTYVVHEEPIDPEFAMYIQDIFLEVINDLNNVQITTFPVITAQFKVTEERDIEDEEFFQRVCEINLPYGYLNIYNDTSLTAISSCCRLINNIEDIINATKDEYMNLIGGSSIKVGSTGVVTGNLARAGLVAEGNQERFFEYLESLARDAFAINHARRILIQKWIDKGQQPLYDHKLITMSNQYSTMGINGLYEAVYFMGFDPMSPEGKEFGIRILQRLETITEDVMKFYGYRCNIEQIPAESTAIKLAKADKILYGQEDFELYANQFIPLNVETDVLNRIELQALFEKYFSGGTILHVNIAEKITSPKVMADIISFVIKKGVKYFAINYFFQECQHKHVTIGNSRVCPECGAPIVEYYTRIVGFIRPVRSWQKERRNEFHNRKTYSVEQLTA